MIIKFHPQNGSKKKQLHFLAFLGSCLNTVTVDHEDECFRATGKDSDDFTHCHRAFGNSQPMVIEETGFADATLADKTLSKSNIWNTLR